jgi:uncharacterized protein (TIGR02246 family)
MDAIQQAVWRIIQQINAAWLRGRPEELLGLFHERFTIVDSEGRRLGEGRSACVDSYRDFAAAATVTDFQGAEPQVDVFDATAVVTYRFEIAYTMGGQPHRDVGRDLFVLERTGDRWLAVWRQLVDQTA